MTSASPEKVIQQNGTHLVRYNEMCRAIVACHSVDEVVEIRDKARALEVYAAQALNTDAERKACEIRLRAERRAGEMLREMKDNGQRQKRAQPSKDLTSRATTLSELGITRDQSSKWQALAEVPEEQFEEALRDPATKPSTSRLISKPQESPKINPIALWVWGRLRDFERDRIVGNDPTDLFEQMTETMQADVLRIAPTVSGWLRTLGESE